jgi:hypothetical protein
MATTTHPEVLWAQRSSDTDDAKVRVRHLYLAIELYALISLSERSLRHSESPGHSRVDHRIRSYANVNLFQGQDWTVSPIKPR